MSSQKLIGEYPERLFTDDAAEDAIFEFQMKLKRISNEIEKRNAALEEQYRYFYLHPERVPKSNSQVKYSAFINYLQNSIAIITT